MNETNMVFSENQKAGLLKSLKSLSFANGQLHEWVSKGTLSDEMAKTLPALIESHFADVAKVLNYESHLLEEQEKRYEQIRKANLRIRELEAKLGSDKPIDGVCEVLKSLRDKVYQWWSEEGFYHVNEENFTPYGALEVQFCFMLDSPRSKGKGSERMQHFRDVGFQFADNEKESLYRSHLLDNDHNRKLLMEMLRKRFPSIEIDRIENRTSHDTDNFLIWNVQACINELTDI